MAPETRFGQSNSELVMTFLKSEEFKSIIKEAIDSATNVLLEQIASLKNEVVMLRESNIEMVHLLTNVPSNSGIGINKKTEPTIKSNISALNKSKQNEIREINTSTKSIDKKSMGQKQEKYPRQNFTATRRVEDKDEMMNTGDEKKDKQEVVDVWEFQRNQKRRINKNEKTVTGTLKQENTFKGVTRFFDYHVYNCEPQLTVEELRNYIKNDILIPEVTCEKMNSKHPERYSSFKVSVPVNYIDNFKNPNVWPEHVCVNKFKNYFLRERNSKEMA